MKASVLIMTLLLAVTFPLIACDDDNGTDTGDTGSSRPDATALCNEGLCADPGVPRDACIDTIDDCVDITPEIRWDECIAAGLLICNPIVL